MVRKTFETEIQRLKDEVLLLGSMVEQATLDSVEALRTRNLEASKKIIEADKTINARRFAIENQVMIAIATQQPMAHDLRLLASILEVSGELERMGDYAKGISVINLRMVEPLKPISNLPPMARKSVDMLHRALTAFVNEDLELARAIPLEDDEVDAMYDQIYRLLMSYVIENAHNIEHANWLIWAAHNLERMADRVTNICERTLFVATGEYQELEQAD
jgi:phosphate transport system protein